MSNLHRKVMPALGSSIALAISMLLAACGGGGGSGDAVAFGGATAAQPSTSSTSDASSSSVVQAPASTASDSAAVTGSSSDAQAPGSGGTGVIKASNIILKSGTQVAAGRDGIIRVQASQLPDNVKVLASNVSIENGSNALASTNLQSALDREIAVDLSKTLVGVWNVENLPANGDKCGTATGQVEFKSDGSYVVLSGAFTAAFTMAPATADCASYVQWGSSRFTVVDGVVQFDNTNPLTHTETFAPGSRQSAISQVTKSTVNAVTFYYSGALSRLTRATPVPDPAKTSTPAQPVSVKPQAQPQKSVVAVVAQG